MGHDGGGIQDQALFESAGTSRSALGSFVATQQGSRRGTMVQAGCGLLEQGQAASERKLHSWKNSAPGRKLASDRAELQGLVQASEKTDTQFAEQQRGDVESHLIGLGTPKGIACSTKIGPVGGGQGVQHG